MVKPTPMPMKARPKMTCGQARDFEANKARTSVPMMMLTKPMRSTKAPPFLSSSLPLIGAEKPEKTARRVTR